MHPLNEECSYNKKLLLSHSSATKNQIYSVFLIF